MFVSPEVYYDTITGMYKVPGGGSSLLRRNIYYSFEEGKGGNNEI